MAGTPRQHPKSQINAPTKSFEAFGQALPITCNKDIFLPHILRVRLDYPELKRKVRALAEQVRAGVVLIEARRVHIPSDVTSLHDFLHEFAMFPKGKTDDQDDSMAQALVHIGKPPLAENWIKYTPNQDLRRYGLKPAELATAFDHIHLNTEFTSYIGRNVFRDEDGFYHCSMGEWDSFCIIQVVSLIVETE